jgi:beta-phosphoglucomutase
MQNTQPPSGVIFDFDGVIVDSLSVHLQAWQIAFKDLFHEDLTDTAGLAGRSTLAIADILSRRVKKPEAKEALAERKREVLRQSQHQIKLLPGAREAFHVLKEADIPFGIASNAPRAFIERTLDQCYLSVDVKLGIDDVARGKPEPDVFLKCAKTLGISVLNHPTIMIFEDSPHGLLAAVKARMTPIGVLTQNSELEMRDAGARFCCKNIQEAIDRGWFQAMPIG